jgi:type II secretory pathway pseudopilin PulG
MVTILILKDRETVRSCGGSMLIEMMVATLLLGVIAAGLVSLVVINNSQSQRLLNKVDTINDARLAIERIGRTWRMARSVGDLYGPYPVPTQGMIASGTPDGPTNNISVVTTNSTTVSNLENGYATLASASFPAAGDPAWGNGQVPVGGWPWSTQPFPYTLSQNTLIIQVPIFTGGYPQAILGPVVNLEAVDTYVYQVLPDAANPGQYILQVASFPGTNSQMPPSSSTPQTILRGIVGPVDSGGNLVIFQYISRNNPTQLLRTVNDSAVSSISGLVVTFELIRNVEGPVPTTVGLKSEVFMRNNSQSTVIGS